MAHLRQLLRHPVGAMRVLTADGKVLTSPPSLRLFRPGLSDSGWTASNRRQQSVDGSGLPLPWITYSAIHFLESRVRPAMRAFEYGAGNSTKWWAKRAAQVVACEHDPGWVGQLADLPSSVGLITRGGSMRDTQRQSGGEADSRLWSSTDAIEWPVHTSA